MPLGLNCFNYGDELVCLRTSASDSSSWGMNSIARKGDKYRVTAANDHRVAFEGLSGSFDARHFDYADPSKKPVKMTDCVLDIIKTSDRRTKWQILKYRVKFVLYRFFPTIVKMFSSNAEDEE